ncbi:MAG: hypothetical protein Q8O61_19805 [Nocardioides sp.]|nr:hypothetical protein [Nocardioides sp.]
MQRDNEDEAWRAIVENFGDRADLDPSPEPEPPAPAPSPAPDAQLSWDDPDTDWSTDRFVPPPPPPIPTTTKDRLLAWIGIFGSPSILLFCLVLGIDLPPLLGYALVAGFVGGFLYLVLQMPRGPRDPGDDGARI